MQSVTPAFRAELSEQIRMMVETRDTLYGYVRHVVIEPRHGWRDGEHIRIMCDTIDRFLAQDERQGLIITMPPRHMKSTVVSNCLPAQFISRNPQKEVIMASYGLDLARDNARACRSLFDEPLHRRVWPGQVFDVDTADSFQLAGKRNGKPNLVAAGVGGGITGKGADLFIIDDPIKDMEQASSETYRRKTYEWYQMVVQSRLAPGGKKILMMTRWHYDDLVGAILRDDPDSWIHLNLPAIGDDGRALWPERYDLAALDGIRRVLGSRNFEAQYQGRPAPLEGGMFKREWMAYGAPMGHDAVRCRYWDKAATHDDGDWTVGCLMAAEDGRYCIEDIVRLQGSPYEVQQTIRRTAEMDGPEVRIRMEQEPGSSGVDVIDHYARNVLTGYDFRPDKVTGNKELRAGPMAAAMECGNLWFARGHWNRELESELLEFPLGAHDDQVDACSGAFRELSSNVATTNFYVFRGDLCLYPLPRVGRAWA